MADNKQYITQEQENGSVIISEDVICTIVAQAVNEVEGVIGLSAKTGVDIAELLGKKNWNKGMKLTLAENSVCVDCNVVISYGQSVVAVAGAVQEAVTTAVESMTGIKVSAVNINVCGIERK